jgi:cytochrome P450
LADIMTQLPDYFDCPAGSGTSHSDPYPGYAALRTNAPVYWSNKLQAWLVSRRADVQSMLNDPRWSSNFLNSRTAEVAQTPASPRVLLFMDGPDHLRLRRAVSHHVNALLPMIRAEVQESVSLLLEGLSNASEMEFASEFASPLATRVLAALIGIPDSDLARLASTAQKMTPLIDWTREGTALDHAQQEIVQFTPYLLDLLRYKRRHPGNDLVSLLNEDARSRTIGYSDIILITILMIAAGHLTSVHMLCNGLLAILRHAHVIDGYAAAAFTPAAILEEVLRFDAPVQATPRTALVDLELGGKMIRRGDIALALLGSANRDESIFPDPDSLDPGRKWRGTMSFGVGPHCCLGAGVARTMGEVAFAHLLAGYPNLHLAKQSLSWRPTLTQHGLAALRVRLT